MNAATLSQYLAKSIAVVVIGSNDYINNYLLPTLYGSSYNYTAPEFGNLLVNSYVRQILVILLSHIAYVVSGLPHISSKMLIFRELIRVAFGSICSKFISNMLHYRHYIA